MSSFEGDWRKYYGQVQPASYVLRTRDRVNWIRFHSLPGSKRYPESAAEWTILLQRQAALAAETIGSKGWCWLVAIMPAYATGQFANEAAAHELEEDYRFFDADGLYGIEGTEWIVSAAAVTWSFEKFEPLLRNIANDEGPRMLWMSRIDGSVFAPYDGGVDLFLGDPVRRRGLAMQYSGWLSVRPDGL